MNTEIQPARRHNQAGFSLVELAIVLIIIGLIVGGVLKGQDLIESARVNSIQTQLNEVRVASTTFINKYDDLPGDINRTDLFTPPNTDGGDPGDGNGRVEGQRMGATNTDEPIMFWWHLQIAGLLGGVSLAVDAATPPAPTGMDAGQGYESRLGGLYTIAWDDAADAFGDVSNGHWIMLGQAATGDTENVDGVLTAVQLRGIDSRADDGIPGTGNILGADGDDATANDCVDANEYAGNDQDQACIAAFKL